MASFCLRTCSFLLLAFVLDDAYVGTQTLQNVQHRLLLFSGDASEQPCLEEAVCCAEPRNEKLPGNRQRDERVAIILGIEATAEHSFGLQLLDQTSDCGTING